MMKEENQCSSKVLSRNYSASKLGLVGIQAQTRKVAYFCIKEIGFYIFPEDVKYIWVKVFKNGSSKICGRQPLKKLKGCLPQSLLGPLLNTLTHLIFRLLKKSFLASLTKFTLTFVCMLAYFSVFFTTKFVKA